MFKPFKTSIFKTLQNLNIQNLSKTSHDIQSLPIPFKTLNLILKAFPYPSKLNTFLYPSKPQYSKPSQNLPWYSKPSHTLQNSKPSHILNLPNPSKPQYSNPSNLNIQTLQNLNIQTFPHPSKHKPFPYPSENNADISFSPQPLCSWYWATIYHHSHYVADIGPPYITTAIM